MKAIIITLIIVYFLLTNNEYDFTGFYEPDEIQYTSILDLTPDFKDLSNHLNNNEKRPRLTYEQINYEATKIARENKKFTIFIDWLLKNGAQMENVDYPVAYGEEGLIGMGAYVDIPSRRVIMAIPAKMIIRAREVQAGDFKPFLDKIKEDYDEEELDQISLAVFLIRESMLGKNSFWYPYLNCVSSADGILFWTEEEIRSSQNPYFIKKSLEYIQYVNRLYEDLAPIAGEFSELFPQKISKELFFYYYEFTESRMFAWKEPIGLIILPFVDFANHKPDQAAIYSKSNAKSQTYDKDNDFFFIATSEGQSYKRGSQIYITYGPRNNWDLLLGYGFTMVDNDDDEVIFQLAQHKRARLNILSPRNMIFLDAHVTDEEYENETITVGDEKFNPKHLTDTFKTKHGTLNEDLLAFLRSHLTLAREKKLRNREPIYEITDLDLEIDVISYAILLYKEALKSYTTTIEEDTAIIKGKDVNQRVRFCVKGKVIARRNQKIIIESQINILRDLLKLVHKARGKISCTENEACGENPDNIEIPKGFIRNETALGDYVKKLAAFVL